MIGGEAEIFRWKLNDNTQETLLKIYKASTVASKLEVRLETVRHLQQLLSSGNVFASAFSQHYLSFPQRLVTKGDVFVGFEMNDGNLIPTDRISRLATSPKLLSSDVFTSHPAELKMMGIDPLTESELQGIAFRTILVAAWLHHEGLLMPDFSVNNILMYRIGKAIFPYFIDVDSFLPHHLLNDQSALETIGETPTWRNINEVAPTMERDVWKVGLLFRRFTGLSKKRAINVPSTKHDKKALLLAFGNEEIGEVIWRMASKYPSDRPTFQETLRELHKAGCYTGGFNEVFDYLNPLSPDQ